MFWKRSLSKINSPELGAASRVAGWLGLVAPGSAAAHEASVVPEDVFRQATAAQEPWQTAFDALITNHNRWIAFATAAGFGATLGAWLWFQRTPLGRQLDRRLRHSERTTLVLLRLLVAAHLLAGASVGRFFGPELKLAALPYGDFIQFLLIGVSLLLAFGFLTESAALISLAIVGYAAPQLGWYLLNYLPTIGALGVFLIFGSRSWSLDHLLFGDLHRLADFAGAGTVILRISLGAGLIYGAVTTKLMHPDLVLEVINRYGLAGQPLLPNDPLLIVLGGALVEIALGLLLIVGVGTRLVVIALLVISLVLGQRVFHEPLWPHLVLYGASLSLLASGGGPLSLDRLFVGNQSPVAQKD